MYKMLKNVAGDRCEGDVAMICAEVGDVLCDSVYVGCGKDENWSASLFFSQIGNLAKCAAELFRSRNCAATRTD